MKALGIFVASLAVLVVGSGALLRGARFEVMGIAVRR